MVEDVREFDSGARDGGDRERDYFSSAERAVQQAESQRAWQISRFEQNLLNTTTIPETVRRATREIMQRYETVTVRSPQLEDRYGGLNIYHGMRSRAAALKTGGDPELVDYLGLRQDGILTHRYKFPDRDEVLEVLRKESQEKEEERANLAELSETEKELWLKENEQWLKGEDQWLKTELRNRLDTLLKEHEVLSPKEEEQRDMLIAELDRSADEMEVREKFDDLWGLYLYVQGNLREFRRIPFTAENRLPVQRDWTTLFNLPATAERGWNAPEAHKERMEGKLGERIDLGIRLYLIAALSERPAELKRIRETPGYRDYVIEPLKQKLAQLEEKILTGKLEDTPATRGLITLLDQYKGDPDKAEKVFIGDIVHWRPERKRRGTASEEGEGPETIPERRGNRGLLTMHGNIFARKEKRYEMEEVNDAVAMILGGDKTAQELARRMFHTTGLAPYYGNERDQIEYDEKGNIVKQEIDREGAPFSNALERVMDLEAYMLYKQKNREWGGPDLAIRRYPKRLLTHMFRHISVPDPRIVRSLAIEPGLSEDERKEALEKYKWTVRQSERSLWELMWEGRDGKRALRLGEIHWQFLNSYFWKDYTIRLNFAGGEGQLFDTLTADERVWDRNAENFQDVRWWRNYATALRVCLGSWVVIEDKQFGWKEWFDENKYKIESDAKKIWQKSEERKRKGEKKDRVWSMDGARDKAAKELLNEQRDEVLAQMNEALDEAIFWYYGNIVDAPRDVGSVYTSLDDKITHRRKLAGIVLPGEKKVKFSTEALEKRRERRKKRRR